MSFEPKFDKIDFTAKNELKRTQAVVEARILPRPGTAIARVLSVAAKCNLSGVEVFNGEVRYTGRVGYTVLFVDVNGDNHATEYSADFSDKLEEASITPTSRVKLDCSVLDTDIVSVTGGELKLASVVELVLYDSIDKSIDAFVSADGVYTTAADVDYTRLIASNRVETEISARLDNPAINGVLCTESSVSVTSVTAGVDCVTVRGEVITHILGETEDGLMASYRVVSELDEELELNGVRPENTVLACVAVSTTTDYESDGESGAVNLLYELTFELAAFDQKSSPVVTDVFSVTNELIPTVTEVDFKCVKPCKYLSECVDGSVTTGDNLPIVDNILGGTAYKLNVTNAVALDGEALIEGIVEGNVIYYSAEAASKASVAVELPFSIKVDGEFSGGDTLTVSGVVTAVNTKIRRGNEIDLKADVNMCVCATENTRVGVVTGLSVGESVSIPEAAISVHIAGKNQSLWEISKALGATPETIMEQNPNLIQPFEGGERIIIYRALGE